MSFHNEGKSFPFGGGVSESSRYASAIADALHNSLANSRARMKIVAAWTGANERTVKNWFSGQYGPSGEHLVGLMRHSDDVLQTVLVLAGRTELIMAIKVERAERALQSLIQTIRTLDQ